MTATLETVEVPPIGRIPVGNILLLMWYASEMYRDFPSPRNLSVEDAPDDLPDLVARFLSNAVERRMRRNLSLDYHRRHADFGPSSRAYRHPEDRTTPTSPARQGSLRL